MDLIYQLFYASTDTAYSKTSQLCIGNVSTKVTMKVTECNGANIRFQHRLWKIKLQRVCFDLKKHFTGYTTFTQQDKRCLESFWACDTMSIHSKCTANISKLLACIHMNQKPVAKEFYCILETKNIILDSNF